jgi:hypothetical protein
MVPHSPQDWPGESICAPQHRQTICTPRTKFLSQLQFARIIRLLLSSTARCFFNVPGAPSSPQFHRGKGGRVQTSTLRPRRRPNPHRHELPKHSLKTDRSSNVGIAHSYSAPNLQQNQQYSSPSRIVTTCHRCPWRGRCIRLQVASLHPTTRPQVDGPAHDLTVRSTGLFCPFGARLRAKRWCVFGTGRASPSGFFPHGRRPVRGDPCSHRRALCSFFSADRLRASQPWVSKTLSRFRRKRRTKT